MKKSLIFVFILVMVLSLVFVACKKDDKVSISVPETVELQAGNKVDWKEYVTVTVNGVAVEDPEITWELKSGNENVGGICRYTIFYPYNGQTYLSEGIVKYTEVSIVVAEQTLRVGSAVDFNGKVTVKINGEARNPVITSVLKSGDPTKVGDCVYTVSFQEDGKTYTAEGTVHFRKAIVAATVTEQNVEFGDDETDVEYISEHVTLSVTVEGEPVTSEITWKLVDGQVSEPDVNCKYEISFEHQGENYTAEVAVLFKVPDVKIVASTQHLEVGETVDWNGHVRVYVNDVEKDVTTDANFDPNEISWQLKSGDPASGGTCVYTISVVYKGETYESDGVVSFKEPQVLISASEQYLLVGGELTWDQWVTVRIDNVIQQEPDLDITLKSGDPTAVGACVYTITFTYKSKPYTAECTVHFVDQSVDPNDVDELESILKKSTDDYESYTFTYNYYEVGKEEYYVHETDKVILSSTTSYSIDYTDVNYNDNVGQVVTNNIAYYLTVNGGADELYYYRDMGSDTPDWKYTKYSLANDAASYNSLVPMAFLLGELNDGVTKAYFVKLDTNVYQVKEGLLNEFAQSVFGVSENETYTRAVLETDGQNVTKITGYYTTEYDAADASGNAITVSIDSVVTLTWSDFNGTSFEIPQATEYVPPREDLPEYIKPDDAEELTPEQQQALTEALGKTYESITSRYTNDKGEMYYWYSGLMKLTANASYTEERELGQYKDWVMSDITTSYYCLKKSGTTCDVWQMISQRGDYIKYPDYKAGLTDFGTYFAIADFGFTADMFGIVDGTYVVKTDKLAELKTKFSALISTSNFTVFDVITFTVKLDSNGNVTEWYLLADCKTTDNDIFYWQLTFTYSDFNSTTVTFPQAEPDDLTELDETQKQQANDAFGADYSNVTVKDVVNDSTMYFMGDNVTVKGSVLNDAGYIESFTDEYVINNGLYYEVIGGNNTLITKDKFEEYVLRFNFNLVNVDKLKYDAGRNLYYLSADDIDADAFALYYKGFLGDDNAVSGFAFEIEDGRVVSVTTYFNNATVSATLSNFGTTVVPVEDNNGTTEA